MDGANVYIRFPLFTDKLPAGKTWIRGDAKELSSGDGQLGQFGSFAGTDPKDVLGLLRAISGTIEAVGTDTVRGVETSHYRATIDVKKLVTLVPAAQRQSLAGFDGLIGKSGLANIPVDVWIDSEQRVRKLVLDASAAAPGSTEKVEASVRSRCTTTASRSSSSCPHPSRLPMRAACDRSPRRLTSGRK